MPISKILVVDDEDLLRDFLCETLSRKKLQVTPAKNGQQAFAALKKTPFDLVITDMKLPDTTGIEILKKAKELYPSIISIVITAYGSIENAVEAMRLGAFNYLMKPFSPDTLEALIDKAKEHQNLRSENNLLREQIAVTEKSSTPAVIAESPQMKKILADLQQIAVSNANVFITGESGTGKEVIAHAIHHSSPRADHPFIKVNCAAIPDTLIESEFFGYEKGAFTGAINRKQGRVELANRGTLLLDEISETPLMLQAKLLRVIQEQEFERVGGTVTLRVDVRFISTSNRSDIRKAIDMGILREDLLYRLNVVPIFLPPLRERKEDIVPLAEFFVRRMCNEYHLPSKRLSQSAKDRLIAYPWPGNVRELSNVIERAIVLQKSEEITADMLSMGIIAPPKPEQQTEEKLKLPQGMTLHELEQLYILETIKRCSSKREAANLLGISERTLRNRLQQHKSGSDG